MFPRINLSIIDLIDRGTRYLRILNLDVPFQALFRKTLDTISKSCSEWLVPVEILDYLMKKSTLLATGEEFIQTLRRIPNFQSYHETVWPAPKSYLPPNLSGGL